jgi:polar amino acid transport system substrate-binding protein
MKRLTGVIVAVALLAAALAAWGTAATRDEATSSATAPTAKQRAKLPALPRDIRQRKRWRIGIKCDAPPFGYINIRGENAGFDVEIARWFSRFAFGRPNRVSFTCAPTPVREPLLTNNRVDLVIATFTYTRDRDTRIDFSRAYYRATGRLLVKNDSPIRSLNDLGDKTVSTTSGSIYDRWMKRCFPNTRPLVTDNLTNALLAFQQGRADAVMWDDTVLAVNAAADPNTKLTNDLFLTLPYGIGIRQGNVAMKRWVDSRLEIMRKRDLFMRILRNNIARRFVPGFSRNILRPKNRFGYAPATAPAPDTVCP